MDYNGFKSKSIATSRAYLSQTDLILQEQPQLPLNKVEDAIPCLFLPGLRKEKFILFFHGNGEDISSAYEFGNFVSKQLQTSVIIMEYRGYSVYGGSPNAQDISRDAARLMEFLAGEGIAHTDIVLFGRSIGGAIALELASKFQVSSLVLLSPFLSLKKIVGDLYGEVTSCMIKETLDNERVAGEVECPVLIIHGLKDALVPFQHSVSIVGQCKGYSRLKLVPHMTHVKFNFRLDFILPLRKFLADMQVIVS